MDTEMYLKLCYMVFVIFSISIVLILFNIGFGGYLGITAFFLFGLVVVHGLLFCEDL